MYNNIIDRLSNESRRVSRIPLETYKVVATAKLLSEPILENKVSAGFASVKNVGFVKPFDKKKSNKIPIVKATTTRFPTKLVNFEEDIPWL